MDFVSFIMGFCSFPVFAVIILYLISIIFDRYE